MKRQQPEDIKHGDHCMACGRWIPALAESFQQGYQAGPSGPALRGLGAGPERSAGVLPITGGSGAKARYRWADPPEGRHCGRGGLAITASLCEVVGGLFWFALILYVYVMGLRALPEKLASCLKCAICDKICEHTGATTAT